MTLLSLLSPTRRATANRQGPALRGSAAVRTLCWASLAAAAATSGCLAPSRPLTALERRIAEAADPILTLDPNANWTACFNELVKHGPDAVTFLCTRPAIQATASPDDLNVLMHLSLVRLLANPATRPRLSVCALETRFDLLYLDIKVRGESLGPIAITAPLRPRTWTGLYPTRFDHQRAAEVNLEADRRALRAWFLRHAGSPAMLAGVRPLRPQCEELWEALRERRADVWEYGLDAGEDSLLVCDHGAARGLRRPRAALLALPAHEYNLPRAVCIWLGSRPDWTIQERLISLVASPTEVVAHNARFALRFSPDPRIRAIIERDDSPPPAPKREPAMLARGF